MLGLVARVIGVFAIATTCLALSAAPAAASSPASGRPVLLLLHAGGFVFGVSEMPYAERTARRFGFRPRFVDYPAGDLPGAVRAARRAAIRAERNGHRVFAYGESAGGTLAALLAQGQLALAASTYCPVPDMASFTRHHDNPELYQQMIQASDRDLRRFSPNRHESEAPIRVLRARRDSRWFNRDIARWDRSDADVLGLGVPGEHLGDPDDPSVYRRNARRAIRWLARAGLAPGSASLHLLK